MTSRKEKIILSSILGVLLLGAVIGCAIWFGGSAIAIIRNGILPIGAGCALHIFLPNQTWCKWLIYAGIILGMISMVTFTLVFGVR